ncbi:MAG: sigma-70 family RNA polymerase sigma factor [Clostridia bacterium]|nr:sigma-70 family RNA polymerase sigma factor [Clostridia bacterium]
MKRKERLAQFHSFYQNNYKTAMNYVLCKTGDFLNGEELLERAFSKVYRSFMKAKILEEEGMQQCLYSALREVLASYNKKEPKPKKSAVSSGAISVAKLLEKELNLSREIAEQKMILHDILAYVSKKPKAIRRAFTYHVYYNLSLVDIANELNLTEEEIEKNLSSLLAEINDHFLAEYEEAMI